MSGKKAFSIQLKEILMEQKTTYPCLHDKSEMSYKKGDVNRNAWSRVAEKLYFIQNIYKCRQEKPCDCSTIDRLRIKIEVTSLYDIFFQHHNDVVAIK